MTRPLEHHEPAFAERSLFLHLALGLYARARALDAAITSSLSPTGPRDTAPRGPEDPADAAVIDAWLGVLALCRAFTERVDSVRRPAPRGPAASAWPRGVMR